MNTPEPSSTPASQPRQPVRGPEIGPASRRDVFLQQVRAARKRLAPNPHAVPRLR
jgi:hypothetical protein